MEAARTKKGSIRISTNCDYLRDSSRELKSSIINIFSSPETKFFLVIVFMKKKKFGLLIMRSLVWKRASPNRQTLALCAGKRKILADGKI